MNLILFLAFALTGGMTFGTSGRDVPVAARILEDGSCAVILQCTPDEGPMSYMLAIVSADGSDPVLEELNTGIENPAWTRGCGWTSDSSFVLQLSSWDSISDFSTLLKYSTGPEHSESIRIPEDGSLFDEDPGYMQISSFFPSSDGSGYLMTVDICDVNTDELRRKNLISITDSGDTLWVSEVPVEGYWMNPDVIRIMPDGGCVVVSDEDGFSDILYVSRFSRNGRILWSTRVPFGGDMTHEVSDILPAGGGGTLLIGNTDLENMRTHCITVYLDHQGNVVNRDINDGLGNMVCNCGLRLDNGGFLLAGWTGEEEDSDVLAVDMIPVLMLLDAFGNIRKWNMLDGAGEFTDPRFILKTDDGLALVGYCWDGDGYYTADAFVDFVGRRDIPSQK